MLGIYCWVAHSISLPLESGWPGLKPHGQPRPKHRGPAAGLQENSFTSAVLPQLLCCSMLLPMIEASPGASPPRLHHGTSRARQPCPGSAVLPELWISPDCQCQLLCKFHLNSRQKGDVTYSFWIRKTIACQHLVTATVSWKSWNMRKQKCLVNSIVCPRFDVDLFQSALVFSLS